MHSWCNEVQKVPSLLLRVQGLRLIGLIASFSIATPLFGQNQFANFETPQVHPVEMTPDGTTLLVANTADDRIEVFQLGGTLPVWVASIPVGLEPVSIRARSNTEAWVVNHLSDSVSIVNLTTRNVSATFSPGDEPTDVVFAGNPQRAFVCVSRLNQVSVYDPANLAAPPTIVPIQGSDPRALATDGTRVFAVIFHSGNRSMILPSPTVSDPSGPWGGMNPPPNSGNAFNPPIAQGLPAPPPVSLIVNHEVGHIKDDNQGIWDNIVTWDINQHEVAVINASTLAVTYASNMVNNINMAVAVQPGTGRVTFTGHYLRNEARYETVARAQFNRVNICSFDPLNPPTPQNGNGASVSDMNQHLFVTPPFGQYITSATAAQILLSVSDPRGMAWNAAGTAVYVSGMGSNNVIKTNLSSQRMATIAVGNGPTGLAMDTPRNRLYCLNRFDGTVSVINTSNDSEIGRVSFFDPTPPVIKNGRPLLYDAHFTSRLGQAACASCHVDARSDAQAWDLGDPSGVMKVFNQTCGAGTPFSGICNDWHPMKGPMVTQPLIGSIGGEPLHWRGDREDIEAFSVGFTGLLGEPTPPTLAQMVQLGDFLATIRFAPNPFRTIDDQLPASVPGFAGNPVNGETLFSTAPLVAGVASCVNCHAQPGGGLNTLISTNVIGGPQAINVPSLRELYRKSGFSFASTTNSLAFGFTHDGSADTIFNYLQRPQFTFPAGPTGIQQRHDLEAYLMCFDSGTHPAVGTQITVTGINNNDPAVVSLIDTMTQLADSGVVSLIAKGRVGGIARGYMYLTGADSFQSDRLTETVGTDALRQLAVGGGEITFTVVPSDTEARIGIDRDGDGYFDRDELDASTDPNDPLSFPPQFDPAGPVDDGTGINQVRYISFKISADPGTSQAIRVSLVQLMHPNPPNLPQFPAPNFTAFEGEQRWVGPVSDCLENESPPATFKCALVQCVPYYADWSQVLGNQTLHVTGAEIVPSSQYDISAFGSSCMGNEDTCTAHTPALSLKTERWGDVSPPFQAPSPQPLTQPNVTDIATVVDKFKALPTAAIVARCDLSPSIPDLLVNISDVAGAVDAFKGLPYVFPGPSSCP
ncbi:MAG: hypothetical protein HY287_08495 [Planctomycetes bacterium]|nr:hypothetical protein [Planctomycetota bacterium]MBI3834351.1 hypothetical protein [Planctomycetota bacterium]